MASSSASSDPNPKKRQHQASNGNSNGRGRSNDSYPSNKRAKIGGNHYAPAGQTSTAIGVSTPIVRTSGVREWIIFDILHLMKRFIASI